MIVTRLTTAVLATVLLTATLCGLPGCEPAGKEHTLEVTATAYTLRAEETKRGNVGLAAWGDQLEPGMKAIAVSRDLISLGLNHETRVRIEGLPGYYVVRDKMNRRWRRKIDIFMGNDLEAAREWGRQENVQITWWVEEDEQ